MGQTKTTVTMGTHYALQRWKLALRSITSKAVHFFAAITNFTNLRTCHKFLNHAANHELLRFLLILASFSLYSDTLRRDIKGQLQRKFLLQNIFGFCIYISNIYVKLSTETVIS